ncbi:MAG: protein kinase [Isosphaeraceae bacterium]
MLQLDDFAEKVALSGLVPTAELTQARAQVEPEPAADASVRLAQLLVQQGFLTTYQARKLLAGATRGFFLGGCRILSPLGEGGMGKVFLAVNEQTFGKVAIKVLPPRKAIEEAGSLVRFRREMELSQRCDHPNVARTLAVGTEGDVNFIVLEYIPGMSLFDMVRSERYGPLRVSDAARLFLKVLDGLDAAHQAGLVHRDIKPSNIMIMPDGNAKILDLGLARAMGEEKGITRANTVLGTLDYASPEQLSDASRADVRSDLYSVGCTLYFTLSGRPPFEGGDVINKIFRQAAGRPRTTREDRPGCTRGLRRHGPQADGQEARRALSDLQGAARRHGALDRPHPAARDPGRGSRGRAILPSSPAPSGRRRPALAVDRRRYQPQRPVAARPGRCRALAGSASSLTAASACRRGPAPARARPPYLAHEQRHSLAAPFFPDRPGTGPDRHPHDRRTSPRLMAGDAGAGVLRQPAG